MIIEAISKHFQGLTVEIFPFRDRVDSSRSFILQNKGEQLIDYLNQVCIILTFSFSLDF